MAWDLVYSLEELPAHILVGALFRLSINYPPISTASASASASAWSRKRWLGHMSDGVYAI